MKRNIFGISLIAIALSGFLFVSCEKDTKIETVIADVPALTVSNLTVASAGGQYSVTYSVSNAATDGVVSATADVSWISNVTVNSGAIAVTIAENTSDALRSGNVTVEYTYTSDGASRTISEKAGIVQYGAEAPVLTVQPNAVSAAYGGGSYSFSYSVANAVDDGKISCTTDVEWITNFNTGTFGTVSFTVAENTSGSLRTGTITVSYAYTGATLTKEVTVIQDHPGDGTSGGGGGDDVDMIGTYTATGLVNGQGYSYQTVSWTVKIYAYSGALATGSYSYWYDGVTPWSEGAYAQYGDHRASAGIKVSGSTVSMPTQFANATLSSSSGSYYLMYTPCVDYADGSVYYSKEWPAVTFTYNSSTGIWTSDYGVFMAGATATSSFDYMTTYFQVVTPVMTLTKTADTTSLSVGNKVSHPVTEGLIGYTDFSAK